MKIAVLTSGGVDSSVALQMLKEEGHDVTAFYLKIWLEDELAFLGECPWEDDLKYVEETCKRLDVPLKIIPLQKEYFEHVVGYTIAEVKAGRTPNPDMLCNQRIKFGMFFDRIDESFEKVATGHYAWTEVKDDIAHLYRAPDPIKDQTYFLGYMKQEQVKRALFPLGKMQKSEVRELAKKYDLPNKDRKDSQGVCFLGKIKFRDFIKFHLGEKTGDIIELETGEKLGEHEGSYFYTIGQRKGLYLPDGPWYVVKKDGPNNIVYISHRFSVSDEKDRKTFEVSDLNWITGKAPQKNKLKVKLRHAPVIFDCSLEFIGDQNIKVTLDEEDQGIAAGQFAIFYDEDECLGGGIIQEENL
jgi:tRNA-specific 2-thiouridylase